MPDLTFWRLSMNRIPDQLLELQARFDRWRANRKYNREPIPDLLRDAALEMSRRYPPSLLQRGLKILMTGVRQSLTRRRNRRRVVFSGQDSPLIFSEIWLQICDASTPADA